METKADQLNQRISILLADDDPQVCSAMRLILEQESGIQVIGEVFDGETLLDLLSENCKGTKDNWENTTTNSINEPHHLVLLLDWELPGFSPVEEIPHLRATFPELIIVALSVHTEARQVALATGVDAFVSKSDPPDQVMAKLRSLVP